MNRSRLIAAGTSVGALVAITAGVAAANPAPTKNHATPTNGRAATTNNDRPSPDREDFGSDDQGGDDWRQLPPDPSATDPGFGSGTDQPPAFDPGAGSNFGSNTSSGGS